MLINRKIALPFDFLDDISYQIKIKDLDLNSINYSDCIIIHKNDYMKLCSKIGSDSLNLEFVKMFVKNSRIFKYKSINQEFKNNCVLRIGGYHDGDRRKIYCPNWVIDKLELDNMIDNTCVKCIKGRFYFREQFILPKISLVHLKRIPDIDTLKIILDKKDGSRKLYDSLRDFGDEEILNFFEGLRICYKCIQDQNHIEFYLPSLNIYIKGFISKMKVFGPEDISGYGRITSETKIKI